MLTRNTVRLHTDEYKSCSRLYVDAFPLNERQGFTFEHQVEGIDGHCTVYAYYHKDIYVGFASVLVFEDIAHILYFAVEEELRSKGYGTQIINDLISEYRDYSLIADIEYPGADGSNMQERRKRYDFYKKCGFRDCPIRYSWHDEEYVIVSHGKVITDERFSEFWKFFRKYRRENE